MWNDGRLRGLFLREFNIYVKYMKKNLEIKKPGCSEHILPVPWPFVILRFHCVGIYFVCYLVLSSQSSVEL